MGSSKSSKKDKQIHPFGTDVSTFRKLSSKEKKKLDEKELKQYKKLKHKVKKLKKEERERSSIKNTKTLAEDPMVKNVAENDHDQMKNSLSRSQDKGNTDYWLAASLSGGNQRKSKFLKMLGIKNAASITESSPSAQSNKTNDKQREKELEQQYMHGVLHKGTKKGLGM
ncbi:nucleolar RNA binding protein, human KNOP1 ortholog, implicated in mRNA processing [Schizosaccharomyces pombe]|uniref:Uncharacterized protein tam10 n=1 Tax=Schizosaccharomyces pombe (strain 972 / ATCC 24843) TaxID=284812 RepID=TAM10_SCHPO|nr:protein tam10 [Schizosaccharomyces pombe]G2TRQ9.1 RecName: Full=Uncharacterized protein tam10; AltName: Full=Transcripts altered in meiosis protein 10 [Schizosaccharomyces pombe 972h-]CCD31369.1 sequence orphan [Schizosaccharomyces pombe]|eukprot:NP_001343159.1 protein tam10 [Schizosaccharomyces pombe]